MGRPIGVKDGGGGRRAMVDSLHMSISSGFDGFVLLDITACLHKTWRTSRYICRATDYPIILYIAIWRGCSELIDYAPSHTTQYYTETHRPTPTDCALQINLTDRECTCPKEASRG